MRQRMERLRPAKQHLGRQRRSSLDLRDQPLQPIDRENADGRHHRRAVHDGERFLRAELVRLEPLGGQRLGRVDDPAVVVRLSPA
jgi:hypothetical protein